MRGSFAFQKYEGLGNDFIVVDAEAESISPAQAVRLCDRHFGIGADGVLMVLPPRRADADVRMVVINSDGSVPEMCGNGVRCVAIHLAGARNLHQGTLHIETGAGVRACEITDDDGEATVTVDMGTVSVGSTKELDIDGRKIIVRVASAGNPHAVMFGSFARSDVERLGSRIATHPSFPEGTNVEFASAGPGRMDLVVWERGVGITLACGTGACAAAAVACADGIAAYGAPLSVRLPGGVLQIVVAKDGRTTMRGPARKVFSGVADVETTGA
jgi:diaminopimelate epimerase